MPNKEKTLLSNVPVVNNAFRTMPDYRGNLEAMMTVVGACIKCGAPIYGHPAVSLTEVIVVRRSCTCLTQTFSDTTQTK